MNILENKLSNIQDLDVIPSPRKRIYKVKWFTLFESENRHRLKLEISNLFSWGTFPYFKNIIFSSENQAALEWWQCCQLEE